MSVVEFLTLVLRKQLIFRQFRGLERNDKAEGKIPEGFWEAFERDAAKRGASAAEIVEIRGRAETSLERLRHFRYVSCWTMATTENALLWQVYAPHGIAVRTTVGKLRTAKILTPSEQIAIWSRGMEYADDWSELEERGLQHYGVVPNRLFLHTKRTLFAGENEVRFFVDPPAIFEPTLGPQLADPAKMPAWYSVTFETLTWIEEIVADSSLPDWAIDTLASIAKLHGLKFRLSGR
jgi:hypothetical protein